MPDIQIDPTEARKPLPEIPGTVPDLLRGFSGCPFAPRCPFEMPECKELPPYFISGPRRSVKCWLARKDIHEKESA
jgi:oligopeptide/dipeptide ABC transporter ATP-binding protein